MNDATDSQRFALVVGPHLDAAFNLARWLTNDPHDAEDVVQDACLRAFRFLGGFRGGDGRAWFLTITRNSAYSWLRQHRPAAAHVEYEDDDPSLPIDGSDDDAPQHRLDPELLLRRADDQRSIETALLRLAVVHREVLVLRELEELSYREIGEIAGIPLGTVMSRLSRARRNLRRQLETMERT